MAHMIGNSLKQAPPLGLLHGFATIRSGKHKNMIDLKMIGVVPVTDLARIYALIGELPVVNTRTRLEAAQEAGVISPSGARDLIEAYDLIATARLEHQARRIKGGERMDNFTALSDLFDFERSHLRNAFVVVRTKQSAVGQACGARNRPPETERSIPNGDGPCGRPDHRRHPWASGLGVARLAAQAAETAGSRCRWPWPDRLCGMERA